ncbi:hypothetical protein HMPREF3227_01104 [Corynebacterium sp. CMW7794]|nr:hypothetical protein HMPREF0307_00162 [Corynebacterium sp. DNF00584]KXI18282.1 hypothetical protein HMPREF3227_01104 [Corynebacterium sp. CMW7794]
MRVQMIFAMILLNKVEKIFDAQEYLLYGLPATRWVGFVSAVNPV